MLDQRIALANMGLHWPSMSMILDDLHELDFIECGELKHCVIERFMQDCKGVRAYECCDNGTKRGRERV